MKTFKIIFIDKAKIAKEVKASKLEIIRNTHFGFYGEDQKEMIYLIKCDEVSEIELQ